ncbi:MAG TPA: tRNA pseudouridine(38-40) synthase TruA [Jatrophihabitans sp.]|nr:tRNA pseudouridine(38-40) synthase TruA [Jatrophihabitans sp.]
MAPHADEPVPATAGDGLVRVRLDLGYDGTDFSGWASQPGRRTVQSVLTDALVTVLRWPQARLVVAGRTDTGVHATGQVAHLDLPVEVWHEHRQRLIRRLAGVLPADVRVWRAEQVPAAFDARFAALWRRYQYRISDAEGGPNPLRRHDIASWRRALDAEAMAAAAEFLLGEHNFAAYCRAREGASTVRGLQQLSVVREADVLELTVQADAFCHSMVRSLVGALAAVGAGLRPVAWPASLLALDRRCDQIVVAPPHGLTLERVAYPEEAGLAARTEQTRAYRGLSPRQ